MFDDPLAASRLDPDSSEERWQTIGMIGRVVVFVVHTSPRRDAAKRRRGGPHHQCAKGDRP
ncbi:MAG TPA: BrnT family toxin [Stellaceae bacterium]|nr:BrnT family toxin [Stellaceae bacterium]